MNSNEWKMFLIVDYLVIMIMIDQMRKSYFFTSGIAVIQLLNVKIGSFTTFVIKTIMTMDKC